jgi:hypothetical protein
MPRLPIISSSKLERGFARVVCPSWQHEVLVPFKTGRALGPHRAPVLIEALGHAGQEERCAALLALRLHGYEVWGRPEAVDEQHLRVAAGSQQLISVRVQRLREGSRA